MMLAKLASRTQLQSFHGERVQKFARRFRMEQGRSYRLIFCQARQCADTDKIIIH